MDETRLDQARQAGEGISLHTEIQNGRIIKLVVTSGTGDECERLIGRCYKALLRLTPRKVSVPNAVTTQLYQSLAHMSLQLVALLDYVPDTHLRQQAVAALHHTHQHMLQQRAATAKRDDVNETEAARRITPDVAYFGYDWPALFASAATN